LRLSASLAHVGAARKSRREELETSVMRSPTRPAAAKDGRTAKSDSGKTDAPSPMTRKAKRRFAAAKSPTDPQRPQLKRLMPTIQICSSIS